VKDEEQRGGGDRPDRAMARATSSSAEDEEQRRPDRVRRAEARGEQQWRTSKETSKAEKRPTASEETRAGSGAAPISAAARSEKTRAGIFTKGLERPKSEKFRRSAKQGGTRIYWLFSEEER